MDIVEYAETIVGVKLLDYQKIIIKNLYEEYKKNKDIRIIMDRHHSQIYFYTCCKELSQRMKGEPI